LSSGARFANAARSTFSASSSSPSTSRRGNARAYGASAVRFLLRARPRHDVAGLTRTIALAEPILLGLGFGSQWVATIETDDPDALGATLRAIEAGSSAPRTSEDCLRERERLNAEHEQQGNKSETQCDVVSLPDIIERGQRGHSPIRFRLIINY
jgi:hypothetical protein